MLTRTAPRLEALPAMSEAGFHRLAYAAWGDPGRRSVVVCAHGLTRTGRDFDVLAEALTPYARVLCPDFAGRGRSSWLTTADAYTYSRHMADAAALIARSGADAVDWIGTSMGGLIGLFLAAQPGTPIRRLVLNDVGPVIPRRALARIGSFVGQDPVFPDFEAAVTYMRTVSAPFGNLSDAQWRHLTRFCVRPDAEGYRLHDDPRIGAPFRDPDGLDDVELWHVWDSVTVPVLVIRGAESDLLTEGVATEMRTRGPGADVVTVPGAGHAPPLLTADQIAPVRAWLQGGDPHAA